MRRVEIDYLAPARLDDELSITLAVCQLGRASLSVEQSVQTGGVMLARAVVTLACVAADTFKPVRIPATLLDRLPRP